MNAVGCRIVPQELWSRRITRTCDCDLMWIKSLCRYDYFKISRWYHLGIGVPLYPMAVVLIRERQREIWATDTEMKVMWGQGQRLELCNPNPRSLWSHWKREDAGKDSSLESWERLQPCWPLDFWTSVLKTATEYISIVLSHWVWWFITVALTLLGRNFFLARL